MQITKPTKAEVMRELKDSLITSALVGFVICILVI